MRSRDFLVFVAVCLTWGLSNVLSRIVVGVWHVPPLAFAAARFALVAAATFPWLRPMPRPRGRLVAAGLAMGAGGFAFLFLGLATATPSAAAIVVQTGVPMTVLLSVVLLGERIHWRRGTGIALTVVGVLVAVANPTGVAMSTGLWFIFASAATGALGAVLMKMMGPVAPLRLQAWVALVSFPPLAVLSGLTEHDPLAAAVAAGWPVVAVLLFSAFVVSLVAHTAYYGLIARYEANLIAPLTLMTPLATIAFGVALTGDRLSARMVAGGALALTGVLVVALRAKPATEAIARREPA